MPTVPPTRNRRPPVKRNRVVQHLRQLIVTGTLSPGERMPTHKALARRFHAESQTICDVMRVLGEDGFIETRHRLGSFVSPHPPHLSQFAFVFPFGPDHTPSQFFRAIRAEGERWQSAARRVLPFYDIHGHTDVEDYQRLLRYVQGSRLAGVVFAANPFALRAMGSPLTETPGLPRVMIESDADVGGFPTVYPDLRGFLPKAFDHLASRGCKRVAVVTLTSTHFVDQLVRIPALAAERGLTVEPHRIQAATLGSGPWVRQLGHLLVHGAPGERPDALVITDDNLVPEITAGVLESGVHLSACGEPRRTDALEIVAHANFPYPSPSAVPAKRLGYDIRELVRLCMERIDPERRGARTPPHTTLPALWEQEVEGLGEVGRE